MPDHVPLVKVRSTTTTVYLTLGKAYESDAAWETSDGYTVLRTRDENGTPDYWIPIGEDRFTCHDSLDDARDAIDRRRA